MRRCTESFRGLSRTELRTTILIKTNASMPVLSARYIPPGRPAVLFPEEYTPVPAFKFSLLSIIIGKTKRTRWGYRAYYGDFAKFYCL
jgi:hypothetical protein